MLIDLRAMGLFADRQKRVLVYYYGQVVGDYNADLTVNEIVICELKAAECLCEENEAQLINYLKATTIEVGLLLNFGRKPEVRRKIFDNDKKPLVKNLYE